jgi:hypothetical protein
MAEESPMKKRLPRLASTSLSSLALIATLVSLPATRAHASLVMALDINDLTQRADHIVVVDVMSVRADWDAQHKKIITTVDLQVVESWKGGSAPASHITVLQPGGTVGDITMKVFGLAEFTPGERSLMFLRGSKAAAGVVGMTQGKRALARDTATGRWMVGLPSRSGVSFVAPAAGQRQPQVETAPRSLDEVRQQVGALLKAAP